MTIFWGDMIYYFVVMLFVFVSQNSTYDKKFVSFYRGVNNGLCFHILKNNQKIQYWILAFFSWRVTRKNEKQPNIYLLKDQGKLACWDG